MKQCKSCNIITYEGNFTRNCNTKDGLLNICKKCSRERKREWSRNNPDKVLQYQRDHYKRDPAVYIRSQIMVRARRNNIPCDITLDYMRKLLSEAKVCPILGIELYHKHNYIREAPPNNSPSVDRIVPELGYVPDNMVVISQRANRLKSDATLDEVRRIYEYMQKHVGDK